MMLLQTAQKNGFLFESYIESILLKTNNKVYSEKDIKKKFNYITSIDHILENNNLILCFQDKCTSKNITNCQINHFISGIKQLQQVYPPNYIFIGIYLSKSKLSQPAKVIAKNHNLIYICDNNIELIYYKLIQYLYSLNIFLYDKDNDSIMIN